MSQLTKLQRLEHFEHFFKEVAPQVFDLYDFNYSMDKNYFAKIGERLVMHYRDDISFNYDVPFEDYNGE